MTDEVQQQDTPDLDPEFFVKRDKALGQRVLHIRVAQEDLRVFDQLCRQTPLLTDTQRVLDATRLAAYLLLMKKNAAALPADVVAYLGLFKQEVKPIESGRGKGQRKAQS